MLMHTHIIIYLTHWVGESVAHVTSWLAQDPECFVFPSAPFFFNDWILLSFIILAPKILIIHLVLNYYLDKIQFKKNACRAGGSSSSCLRAGAVRTTRIYAVVETRYETCGASFRTSTLVLTCWKILKG